MGVTGMNHLAIAVADIDEALGFWRDALGLEVGAVADEAKQGVRVAFLPIPGGSLELVEPTQAATGIRRFLERTGGGIHHVCLEVDDLEAAMARLRAAGAALTSDEPYTNAHGRRLIFVHPKSTGGVLLELYEARG